MQIKNGYHSTVEHNYLRIIMVRKEDLRLNDIEGQPKQSTFSLTLTRNCCTPSHCYRHEKLSNENAQLLEENLKLKTEKCENRLGRKWIIGQCIMLLFFTKKEIKET